MRVQQGFGLELILKWVETFRDTGMGGVNVVFTITEL